MARDLHGRYAKRLQLVAVYRTPHVPAHAGTALSKATMALWCLSAGVNVYFFPGEQVEAHCPDGHLEILFEDGELAAPEC